MAMTYILAISHGFPGVQCHAIGEGDTYESLVWDAGLPIPSQEALDAWIASHPSADYGRRITVLAFRNRFTKLEKILIDIASIDDPNAELNERMNAAAIRADMKDSDSAAYIDLGRDDTRSGVMSMETLGIINAGRALEILDTPVQAHEVPTYPMPEY